MKRSTSARTAAACPCWSAQPRSTNSETKGVTFVLDLTERKRAEAEARESERRFLEVQMELAHANRVATMGQLSASIAHEVNQPIAATVTNAAGRLCAGWRGNRRIWRKCGNRSVHIVEIGHRAGDVVGRIRALIKKAPPRKDRVDDQRGDPRGD